MRIASKTIRCLASVLLIFSFLSACGENNIEKGITTKKYSEINHGENIILEGNICENNRFSLSWDKKFSQVIFTDKLSGAVYSTMPQDAKKLEVDEDGMEIMNSPIIESPIIVYYYDSTLLTDNDVVAATGSIYNGGVVAEPIENGVKVTYKFSEMQLSVPVEYTIDEDCFHISVNPEEIADNGEMFVTGVAIAPFMCSLKNDSKNSYIFIPDGSGALAEPKTVNSIGKQNSVPVYGNDLAINHIKVESYSEQIKLPVFGIKNNDYALCGIITSASDQASIKWNIGSGNIGYSSVYPFFRIKGYNLVKKPLRFLSAKDEIQVYGDNIANTPLEVTYYPLSGEKANYSGMAETYRNYLINTKQLKKTENKDCTVSIKLLGGVEQKAFTFGIPHTVLKPLTKINQANEIVKYFYENINGNLLIDLVGYGESGLDIGKIAGGFKISSKLGKKKDINNLTSFCNEKDITLFMDFDLISFDKVCNGFSKLKDSAKLPNGQIVYPAYYDFLTGSIKENERYLLLSRDSLASAFSKSADYTEKNGFSGISVASLCKSKYSDYGAENAEACAQQANDIANILKLSDKQMVLGSSANAYAACNLDYIIETPTSISRYEIADRAVPFYQMVFRGYVPMSSESINASSDEREVILKCAETGLSPTYTLVYDYDETLVTSKFSALHGTRFDGNKQKIVNVANKLKPLLDKLSGRTVIKHEILENGLRVTTFDGGIRTVVNESDNNLVFDGVEIAARDFAVLEGQK